jgi:hypothetical protein
MSDLEKRLRAEMRRVHRLGMASGVAFLIAIACFFATSWS